LEVKRLDEARTIDWHLTFLDGKVGSAYSFLTPLFVIMIIKIVGKGEFELATLQGILLVVASMCSFRARLESNPDSPPKNGPVNPFALQPEKCRASGLDPLF